MSIAYPCGALHRAELLANSNARVRTEVELQVLVLGALGLVDDKAADRGAADAGGGGFLRDARARSFVPVLLFVIQVFLGADTSTQSEERTILYG